MPFSDQTTCWVVTDGKSGMENQCLGLAEALGLAPTVKRVKLHAPWRGLSPFLRMGLRFAFSRKGDPVKPPWPDLLIATGRLSVPAALYVKRKNPKTFTVQLQNPVIDPSHFDLVVAPEHDGLHGKNILSTRGALHRVTPEMLATEGEKFAPDVAQLRRPYIALLVGGTNAAYKMTPRAVARFAAQVAEATITTGGSLLVTPSRRTGDANIAALKKGLEGVPAYFWDGQGTNPYYGMLGLADYIFVTCDSVNMITEACATGKPVYVIQLPGGSAKSRAFLLSMQQGGFTRIFQGRLEHWSYKPLNEVQRVAERIKEMMNAN